MFSRTAELYDRLYSFKDYPAEAARLRELVVARGGPAGGALLDVACGTGLHLRALAEHYAVEGLDLDEGLLAVARRRLPAVALHHADMRFFDLGRAFGVVTCLFSSIGYVRGDDELRAAVAAMARHVRPGGALAIEPWFTPDAFHRRHVHLLTHEDERGKIARMTRSECDGRTSVLHMEYLAGTEERIEHASERHEMTLFTRDEMRAAFDGTGLNVGYDEEGLTGRGLWLATRPA